MEPQGLAPALQDGGEANLGTEAGSRHFTQGFGCSPEQKAVYFFLVTQYQRVQYMRYSKYNVEVLGRQQVGFACFKPPGLHQRLALGTVPVTTGVVGVLPVTAQVARENVPVEQFGSAGTNIPHHLRLGRAQFMNPVQVCPKHISPFEVPP